jgi:hypothetical protein
MGMIFIPSINGISHAPQEFSRPRTSSTAPTSSSNPSSNSTPNSAGVPDQCATSSAGYQPLLVCSPPNLRFSPPPAPTLSAQRHSSLNRRGI